MSKKQDFIRQEQSRAKHPDSHMAGSAASVEEQARRRGEPSAGEPERQAPLGGKYANDHNKVGEQAPTQRNEGRRTPHSRHDAESNLGSDNQSQVRRGAPSSRERTQPPPGRKS